MYNISEPKGEIFKWSVWSEQINISIIIHIIIIIIILISSSSSSSVLYEYKLWKWI